MARARGEVDPGYGRYIVAIAFAVLGFIGGIVLYSTSVYIDALVTQRGFSLAAASAGPTFSAVTGGLGGLFAARLIRSVPTRTLFLIGAIGLAATLVCLGSARVPWQLWISFCSLGFFGALASGVTVSALVARWFPSAPARPLTIAMTGLALGGAVFPPIVLLMLERFGLSTGSTILAVCLLVLILPAIVLVREPPTAILEAAKAIPAKAGSASLRDPLFFLLLAGVFCLGLSQMATIPHLVRLANENGTGAAGVAVTAMAAGALSSRLVSIPLLPAIGLRRITVIVAAAQATGQLTLSGAHHAWSVLLGAYVLGFAMGNIPILQSLFVIEAYGLADYPRMLARITLAAPIAGGIGPLLIAAMHGWLDGYRWALMAMAVLSVVGGATLLATGIDGDSSLAARARRRAEADSAPLESGLPVVVAVEPGRS